MPTRSRLRKPPPAGYLWSQGAADYLGVHVVTLYRWRRDEIGPHSSMVGRRLWAYKIADLDAYLEGQYQAAIAPDPQREHDSRPPEPRGQALQTSGCKRRKP